ncbi:hypothetical protein ACFFX0_04630 [Citricoccus parietis]|uniref:Uncharacterized protein n=1 Tax=Citricoccus parietis TaxID=592307 RepID=A0ABV5FV46_9MICC
MAAVRGIDGVGGCPLSPGQRTRGGQRRRDGLRALRLCHPAPGREDRFASRIGHLDLEQPGTLVRRVPLPVQPVIRARHQTRILLPWPDAGHGPIAARFRFGRGERDPAGVRRPGEPRDS